MRINVYAEEMTDEVELVTKKVVDEEFGERTFYGLRFFLKSPPELHHSEEDDDRSAITYWVKWTHTHGTDLTDLRDMISNMFQMVSEVQEHVVKKGV